MARHEGKPPGMNLPIPAGVAPVEGDPSQDPLHALAGMRGMVQTRTEYQTAIAVQVPRDLKLVERSILYEAAQMGEDFVYSWEVNDKESPTGKSRIEGMSIDGAMIMMRNWTNAVCPTRLADETASHFLIEATFIDLERGFSIPRLYRQRKNQRTGKMDRDRAEDIAFQIGQSKCQRNAIEKGIPQWLIDRAIAAAKSEAEKRYADVPASVEKARRYAAGLGITDAELVRKVGAPFADWLPRDLVFLQSVFRAIQKKESSITLEFRSDPADEPAKDAPAEPPPEPTTPADDLGFPEIKPDPPPPTASEPKPADAPAPAKSEPAVAPPPPTPKPDPLPPPPTFTPPTTKKGG